MMAVDAEVMKMMKGNKIDDDDDEEEKMMRTTTMVPIMKSVVIKEMKGLHLKHPRWIDIEIGPEKHLFQFILKKFHRLKHEIISV